MPRRCDTIRIDKTKCDGEMICCIHARPPHENMYYCNKCGRQASGSRLIIESMQKDVEEE